MLAVAGFDMGVSVRERLPRVVSEASAFRRDFVGRHQRELRAIYTRARIDLSSTRQASPNVFNGSAAFERASWRISSTVRLREKYWSVMRAQQAFRLGENRLRGGEADAIGQRVEGQQFLGIFERVRECVDEKLRAFAR